jgi:hypothetical protein
VSDLIQRNLDRIATSQANYNESVSMTDLPESSAFVKGYDATRGKAIVQTLQGNVYYCNSQSTGGAAIGDKVPLTLVAGGTPTIDTMPM